MSNERKLTFRHVQTIMIKGLTVINENLKLSFSSLWVLSKWRQIVSLLKNFYHVVKRCSKELIPENEVRFLKGHLWYGHLLRPTKHCRFFLSYSNLKKEELLINYLYFILELKQINFVTWRPTIYCSRVACRLTSKSEPLIFVYIYGFAWAFV